MLKNYEEYLVKTDVSNESQALVAIANILQQNDNLCCFALHPSVLSNTVNKWKSDPSIAVLRVVNINPPDDDPRTRKFIEMIGGIIPRYAVMLRFEGPCTAAALQSFWFDMGVAFFGKLYVGKSRSFPKAAWTKYRKGCMRHPYYAADYDKEIFKEWGILGFSQMNCEPGDPWLTEIVDIAHTSGLGRDFITWGQPQNTREIFGKLDN